MKLQVDRAAVDNRYTIMPVMPLPTAIEYLEWVTNIFISSDLSETRTALAPYPSISITYLFEVGLSNRDWLASLVTEGQQPADNPRNEWVLPYFPHAMAGRVSSGNLTPVPVTDPVNGFQADNYAFGDYYLLFDRHRFIYGRLATSGTPLVQTTAFSEDDEVWIVPCYVAYIDPKVKLEDFGKCRYGHRVTITFRMTGESEQIMTYQTTKFNWQDALQAPLKTQTYRHQSDFTPQPARPNVYTPVAYLEQQQAITTATYWMEYDSDIRQEYAFRGMFMRGLGSFTADNYLQTNKLHRLEDDMVTINYNQGAVIGKVKMREVSA